MVSFIWYVSLIFMFIMSFWSSTIFGTSPDFTFENFKRVIFTELYREQLIKTPELLQYNHNYIIYILPSSFPTFKNERKKGTFCTFNVSPFWTSYVKVFCVVAHFRKKWSYK